MEVAWVPTPALEGEGAYDLLAPYHALWCSPGSPYRSQAGAHVGIQYARERVIPFLGT